MVDLALLVRCDFQTDVGHTGIMQSGNELGNKLQNRWLPMTDPEKNEVVRLKLGQDVSLGVCVEVVVVFNRFISALDEKTILCSQVFLPC